MARRKREQSEHGLYHVMLRGLNQQQLFYDDEDHRAFLKRLARFKDECAFRLYAYSLMGNHVHLLIQVGPDELSPIMKKLTISYAYWFNLKYDRSGYLFQGRFKSEPVDDDTYLLVLFRYILNNPVRIGKSMHEWTSLDDFLGEDLGEPSLTDCDFILKMFSNDEREARRLFFEFVNKASDVTPKVVDVASPSAQRGVTDEVAIEMIKRRGSIKSCNMLAQTNREERDRVIGLLKKEGLTIRQISRLTEINRGIVQRA